MQNCRLLYGMGAGMLIMILAVSALSWLQATPLGSVDVNGARIQSGMALTEVEAVLGECSEGFDEYVAKGRPGTLLWEIEGGCLAVYFVDGRVADAEWWCRPKKWYSPVVDLLHH